jgi:hypothetical protein
MKRSIRGAAALAVVCTSGLALPGTASPSGAAPAVADVVHPAVARSAGSVLELQVTGLAGVPGNAAAVVLNLTAADAQGVGYVTAWPCGAAMPNASNLNYRPGAPVANASIVQVGVGGKVCLLTADAATELIVDVNGWFPAGTDYRSVTPVRVLETRPGARTFDGQSQGQGVRPAGSVYELAVAGRNAGVPADAAAVVLNLTAADAQGIGYVTAWPCGTPMPNASNLNYGPGAPAANASIVKVGAGGKVCLLTADSGTQLIADVNGWFPAGSDYQSTTPARLLETRAGATTADGASQGEGIRAAGSVYELRVTGRAGVPGDASAVVLNVTAADARGIGYVTATPCGSAMPNASSLNYAPGRPVANAVVIKVGAGGRVCLRTAEADTHLVVDVNGWFPAGSDFAGIAPQRLIDTRTMPAAPVAGVAFFESFSGNGGVERFRRGAFHRERDAFVPSHPDWVSDDAWTVDHDNRLADCGDPMTHTHPQAARTATVFHDAELTFVCRDHLMTTMGDVSGYSVTWFSPNQTFGSVNEVCFDASINGGLTGDRQWWEVAVQRAASPDASAIEWLAGTANLPSYGDVGATVLSFGPANPHYYRVSVLDVSDEGVGGFDAAAYDDMRIRRAHCFRDNGNGTITFQSWERRADGSLGTRFNNDTVAGSFPTGDLKVVFKSHAYTPAKSCWQFPDGVCASYTWHWDNIEVRGT